MRTVALVVALAVVAGGARAAAADEAEGPPVGWSIAAGVATALVPLCIGSTLIANSPRQDVQNGGLYLVMGGLALAPIVSHAVAREWKRAAVFGALPVAAAAAMAVIVQTVPNVIADLGVVETRVPFAVTLLVAVLSSAGGLADSFLAGERARRVAIVPTAGPHQVGLSLGGVM